MNGYKQRVVFNVLMSDEIFLEGHISIEAALRSQSRVIYSVLLQEGKASRAVARLERIVRSAGIDTKRVSAGEISGRVGGQSHGGAVASVGPRQFVPIDALAKQSKTPFIAMLDGIEDPFNFGYAVRALYAAGADGLVVRPRNWTTAASIVARASAGASEQIPMAVAESVQDVADQFRKLGFAIACTAKGRSISLYDAPLNQPVFLVIGGEKRGITRSFLDQADLLIEIPYGRGFQQSLGTAAATAVIAFEVMRQRRQLGI